MTSFPVSARHAPATKPTYPLPITATCISRPSSQSVASVHHDLGGPANHLIVDRAVIRHDHHTVRRRYHRRRKRDGPILPTVLVEAGHMRIVIAHVRALTFQQLDDVERRTL